MTVRGAAAMLAAVAAAVALAAAQLSQAPEQGETLRVAVDVVSIYCTVTGPGKRLVTNLEKGDFDIFEDGKKQELRYFTREVDRPITMALLVDTSISQAAVLPDEQRTAALFLKQSLRPSDLALLITFDDNVDLLQDFTSESGRLERALGRARINKPLMGGPFPRPGPLGTRLYDAIYLATNEKLATEVGRKALLILSDGYDAGSTMTLAQAVEAVHRSDTLIYAIGISDPQFQGGRTMAAGASTLKRLAEETGGRAVFPSGADELNEAFDQISAELRSQYSLGYTPANTARDGRFRKVEVKVKTSGHQAKARRGYYASRDSKTPEARP